MKMTRQVKQRNDAGPTIKKLRLAAKPSISQDDLSGRLAARGITLDRSAISRIESQDRILLDFELVAIARALKAAPADLLPPK